MRFLALTLLVVTACSDDAPVENTAAPSVPLGLSEAPQGPRPSAPTSPTAPIPTSAPDLNLTGVRTGNLDEDEQRALSDFVNLTLSPCGEPISIRECVVRSGACRACRRATTYIARLVSEGKRNPELSELYRQRFSAQTTIRVDTKGAPTLGPVDAPITLIEFADFGCPHCIAAYPIVRDALKPYGSRVRFVFMPVAWGEATTVSSRSAAATLAAQKQNKVWQMHEALFSRGAVDGHAPDLSDADLRAIAGRLNINASRLMTDMNSDEIQQLIAHVREEATRVQLQRMPTIIVNGHRVMDEPSMLGTYLREELE